ncbi:MAG: hypothetical protein HY290_25845 [Planctomycetia bacterium]|nr:hypothetical protein [Planctomycetia bacterium]
MTINILPPSLRLLLRMQVRARLRKVARGARTLKGKLYLAAMIVMFTVWLGPTLAATFFMRRSDFVDQSAPLVQALLPSSLLVYCIITLIATSSESGIAFHPAEVDLLFPAPFRRRDLLLYRLTGLGLGLLFTSLAFSLFLMSHVRFWVFGFIGIALAFVFIQLVPIVLTLCVSIMGERAYTRGRRLALFVLAALIAVGIGQVAVRRVEGGIVELAAQFRSTGLGRCLLAPFEVFSRTMTAEFFLPDFLAWGGLALAIDAALVGLVLRLDANFLESSIAASQRLYQKIERMRRGQMWMNFAKAPAGRWRIPLLPRWSGAGPIAWRQLMSALRGSRGIVYFLLAMLAAVAVPAYFAGGQEPLVLVAIGSSFVPMISLFFMPQLLQFDFRSDIDRIDVLKTLPATPAAIVAGELLAPVVFATLYELPFVIAIGVVQPEWRLIIGAGVALVPAINLFVFAFENLVFLWFPHRLANLGAGDFQAFGRQMLVMGAKFVLVGFGGGLAVAAGSLAWWLAGESWIAALAAVWCVVVALSLALIPLVASAFRNFDPSLDTAD